MLSYVFERVQPLLYRWSPLCRQWEQLPEEVLCLITSKFPHADWQSMRRSCKAWRDSLPLRSLWACNLDHTAFASACASYSRLTRVDLSINTHLHARSLEHLSQLPQLISLNFLGSTCLRDPRAGLHCLTVFGALSQLRNLNLARTDVHPDAVVYFGHLPGLVSLNLDGMFREVILDLLWVLKKANLETLRLGCPREPLPAGQCRYSRSKALRYAPISNVGLLDGLTRLTRLSMNSWREYPEGIFAGKVTNLRQLVLESAPNLTDDGLHELLKGLQGLTSLHLPDRGYDKIFIKGPGLRALLQHRALEVLSMPHC